MRQPALGNITILECASASTWAHKLLESGGTEPVLPSAWLTWRCRLWGSWLWQWLLLFPHKQHHLLCSSLRRCLLLSPVRKRTVGDMSFETQFINPPPNLYCWPWLQTSRAHALQQEKLQTLVWLFKVTWSKPDHFFENLLTDSVILILNWILCCRDHLWICVFFAQTVQKSQSICRKLIFYFKMLGHYR